MLNNLMLVFSNYYYDDPPPAEVDLATVMIICTVIAFIIALVWVLALKSAHKTSKPQRAACNYVIKDSFRLNTQKDLFLYRRVTKIPRPQANNASRGGRRR
jgi:flagellar basal body-associated protein FliL